MRKRVLVINTVNTGFTGITSVMMNLVRNTCYQVEYDFVLCWHVEPSFQEELEQIGGHVWRPPCSRFRRPIQYLNWLGRILKKETYDAVHVHGNSGTMFLEMWAAKSAGIPVRIAHGHSTSCKFKAAHYALKPLLNRTMTRGVACSEAAGKWLFDKDYLVIPNAIHTEKYAFSSETRQRYRRELGLEGSFVVGHVGYMEQEKNHLFLLKAFREVLNYRPEAKLMLIGEGSLKPEIEAYIAQKQMHEAVLLLGKRADTAQLYQCMDVFTLPSLYEGLPLTLLEAQASGLRCLTSDRVTCEADLTGNVCFLPIDQGNERWVQEIVKTDIAGREEESVNAVKNICEKGFDVSCGVEKLVSCY